MKASLMVSKSSRVTRKKAMAMRTANSHSASRGDTRRAASGRSRVRRTCGSMSRSAKSLMTSPAARITKTPAMKTSRTRGCGRPAPAIHNAQRAGHKSSHEPTGLSSRVSSAYSSIRRCNRYRKGASSSFGATAAILVILVRSRLRPLPHSPVTLSRPDPTGCERGNSIRVRCEEQLRRLVHARQEIGISHQIGDAHLRQTGLACPQQLTRATQLQIATCNLETIVRFPDHFQPLACELRQGRTIQQYAGTRLGSASHPSAKLMQLRESHALSILDCHECRVRHINTDLDDGRGNQELNFTFLEGKHGFVFLCRRHASVYQTHAHFRERFRQCGSSFLRRLRAQFL